MWMNTDFCLFALRHIKEVLATQSINELCWCTKPVRTCPALFMNSEWKLFTLRMNRIIMRQPNERTLGAQQCWVNTLLKMYYWDFIYSSKHTNRKGIPEFAVEKTYASRWIQNVPAIQMRVNYHSLFSIFALKWRKNRRTKEKKTTRIIISINLRVQTSHYSRFSISSQRKCGRLRVKMSGEYCSRSDIQPLAHSYLKIIDNCSAENQRTVEKSHYHRQRIWLQVYDVYVFLYVNIYFFYLCT